MKEKKTKSIQKRMSTIFVGMILSIFLLAGFALFSLINSKTIVSQSNKVTFAAISEFDHIMELVNEVIVNYHKIYSQKESAPTELLQSIDLVNEEYSKSFKNLSEKNSSVPFLKSELSLFNDHFKTLNSVARQIITSVEIGNSTQVDEQLKALEVIKENLLAKAQSIRSRLSTYSELELSASLNNFIIAFILLSCFIFVLPIYTFLKQNKKIKSELNDVSADLNQVYFNNQTSIEQLNSASEFLASSASEQEASVQESLASMHEISSMIDQTVARVSQCRELSSAVVQSAKDGNLGMVDLSKAMETLDAEVERLDELKNIVSLIKSKTDIINQIVFKTQLLSFNASIEAARAGAHGRGFSVVAQEIGTLAKLSGTASKDIEQLLQDTNQRVESAINEVTQRIVVGKEASDNVQTNFNHITQGIEEMDTKIESIGSASKEQQVGTQETTNALNSVSQTAQKNVNSATEIFKLSEESVTQNIALERISHTVTQLAGLSSEAEAEDILEPNFEDDHSDESPQKTTVA